MRRDAWVGEADMGRQIAEIPFRMRWSAIMEGYALEEIATWSDEQWNAMMRGERPSEATPEATDAVLRLGGA